MPVLILTDIHANLEALEAVLAAPATAACSRLLVLGDLVGYGADPNAVVERIRALDPLIVIRGNHDKVAAGLEETAGFNWMARQAIEWTRRILTPDNRDYLASLASGPVLVDAVVEVCHGSPGDEDLYIFDRVAAAQAFTDVSRPLCFFGHTHVPAVYREAGGSVEEVAVEGGARTPLDLELSSPGARYLVNPGAVGQPRDGDPRAAYAIFEEATERLTLWRQPYRVDVAQKKIAAAGLPEPLANRLGHGR